MSHQFKFFHGYGDWINLPTITMPMISRIFGRTIEQELVDIRPLRTPRGRLFYMDYNYDGERINETIRSTLIFAPR